MWSIEYIDAVPTGYRRDTYPYGPQEIVKQGNDAAVRLILDGGVHRISMDFGADNLRILLAALNDAWEVLEEKTNPKPEPSR